MNIEEGNILEERVAKPANWPVSLVKFAVSWGPHPHFIGGDRGTAVQQIGWGWLETFGRV